MASKFAGNGWNVCLKSALGLSFLLISSSCISPRNEEHCTSIAPFFLKGRIIVGTSEIDKKMETVTGGGSIVIYGLEEKKVLKNRKTSSPVYRVAIAPNGETIATNQGNEAITIIDSNLDMIAEISAEGAVNDLVFAPDSKLLAFAITNVNDETKGGVLLYDLKTRKTERLVVDNECGSRAAAFSPDGKRLACGSNKGIRLWDVAKKQWLATLKHGVSNSISFSSDGRYVSSGALDRTVRIWSLSTYELVETLDDFKKPVTKVAFSPKGVVLAAQCLDDTIRLYDVKNKKIINTYTSKHTIHDFAFSTSGESILVAKQNTVEEWNFKTGIKSIHMLNP